MQAVQGIYDGKNIRLLEPVRADANARVIITFLDSTPAGNLPATRLEDVAGCLHYGSPAKSLADMDAAIQRGVAERWK